MISNLILIIFSFSWPKCPPIPSEPVYIIEEDSTTIIFPGWNANISFEYVLIGSKGIMEINRHQGNLLKIANTTSAGSIRSIELKRLCGDVFSRRSIHKTPQTDDFKPSGGYIKKYGQCTYIKSLLDTGGFVLKTWFDKSDVPEDFAHSPSNSLKLSLPSSLSPGDLLIASEEDPNFFYLLEDSKKAIDGFTGFESPEAFMQLELVEKTEPSCKTDVGSLKFRVNQTIDQQLYFSADNGDTWYPDPEFAQLQPGDYSILVRSGLEGCIFKLDDVYTIGDESIINVNDIIIEGGSYCQSLRGSIKVEVESPQKLIFYLNGEQRQGPVFSNLLPGEYNVKLALVTNPDCFIEYKNLVVADERFLSDRFMTVKDATDCNRKDGEINIKLKGAFEYSIDSKTWQNNGLFSNLEPGRYVVRVRSKDGECGSDEQNVQINAKRRNVPENQKPIINIVEPACFGEATGLITAIDNINTLPNYIWHKLERGEIVNTIYGAGNTLKNLSAGEYRLDHFISQYCFASYEIKLDEPLPFKLENPLNAETAVLCQGSEVMANAPAIPGVSYVWMFEQKRIATGNSAMINYPGLYQLQGTNDAGCKDTVSFAIQNSEYVFNPDFLFPSVGLQFDTLIGVDITLIQPDTVVWQFPGNTTVISANEGSIQLAFQSLGTFAIIMEAYKGRCKSTIQKEVMITDDASLVIKDDQRSGKVFKKFLIYPNPNDGRFVIEYELSEALETRISVYDQLGNKQFGKEVGSTTSHREEASLELLPPGAYVVMVNTNQVVQVGTVIIRK